MNKPLLFIDKYTTILFIMINFVIKNMSITIGGYAHILCINIVVLFLHVGKFQTVAFATILNFEIYTNN